MESTSIRARPARVPTDPALERMRAMVAGIHRDLERLLAPHAARLHCTPGERRDLVVRGAIEYFRALGQGHAPAQALSIAIDGADLGLAAWRVGKAPEGAREAAFLAHLERALDPADPRQAFAIEGARGEFMRVLDAGGSVIDAIAQARAKARGILEVGAAH